MPRPNALDLRNPADAFGTAALTGLNPDGSAFRLPVELPPASAVASYVATSVPANTWTAVVTLTPTTDRELVAAMCDLVGLLGTRYQVRLLIAGVVQFVETVHTDQVSTVALHGIGVPSGTAIALEARHAEATAQDVSGSLIHRLSPHDI